MSSETALKCPKCMMEKEKYRVFNPLDEDEDQERSELYLWDPTCICKNIGPARCPVGNTVYCPKHGKIEPQFKNKDHECICGKKCECPSGEYRFDPDFCRAEGGHKCICGNTGFDNNCRFGEGGFSCIVYEGPQTECCKTRENGHQCCCPPEHCESYHRKPV